MLQAFPGSSGGAARWRRAACRVRDGRSRPSTAAGMRRGSPSARRQAGEAEPPCPSASARRASGAASRPASGRARRGSTRHPQAPSHRSPACAPARRTASLSSIDDKLARPLGAREAVGPLHHGALLPPAAGDPSNRHPGGEGVSLHSTSAVHPLSGWLFVPRCVRHRLKPLVPNGRHPLGCRPL